MKKNFKNNFKFYKQMVNLEEGKLYRGFTLIELLAVIVILAIIAVITIPIITGVIENSKKEAFKDSAYGIIEAANLYYAKEMLNGETPTLTTFTVSNNKLVSGNKELSFNGKVPVGDSYVKINEEERVSLRITDGKYYVSKDYDETGVVLAENEEEALTREELANELAELRGNFQTLQSTVVSQADTISSLTTTVNNNNTLTVASMTDLVNQISNTNNKIDGMFEVTSVSNTVPAIKGQSTNVVTATLEGGHEYLVISNLVQSGAISGIMNNLIDLISGTVSFSSFISSVRTTVSSGGGLINSRYSKTDTDCVIALQSYGYADATYNFTGSLMIIKIR